MNNLRKMFEIIIKFLSLGVLTMPKSSMVTFILASLQDQLAMLKSTVVTVLWVARALETAGAEEHFQNASY